MEYPVVVTLSGPEKTRAKAELALEKARLTIIPPNEWPIQRQSYQAEHWPHLTQLPSGQPPDEEHGFIAVLAETEAAFHAAYTCVEKAKWVLRVHHELPEKPLSQEDPLQRLDQRIAFLEAQAKVPPIRGAAFESGAGEFMQNSAVGFYTAAQLRRSVFAWAARTSANVEGTISGGLLSGTDMQLSAAVSGLVVNTSIGACLIGGTEATSQGGYHGFLSSQNSTTLATANASNPRIDLLCVTSADPAYTIPSGGTSGFVTIQAVTGTPTAGATLTNLSGAPALPASSLLLGYGLVPAAATNLTSANIANKATQVQSQIVTPGTLIGKCIYAPGTQTTLPIPTTFGSVSAANLTAFFTSPSSGAVTVRLQGWYSVTYSAGNGYVSVGVITHGGSQVGASYQAVNNANSGPGTWQGMVVTDVEVTGLTAGTSYQFDWAAGTPSGGSTAAVYAAGPTGISSNGGPATMKVYAA